MSSETAKPRRLRISQKTVADLQAALKALRAGADPTSPSCGVDAVHREAMRLYLRTWVMGPLETALATIIGEKP